MFGRKACWVLVFAIGFAIGLATHPVIAGIVFQEANSTDPGTDNSRFEKVASFDFEKDGVGRRPSDWKLTWAGGFSAAISNENPRTGKQCVRIASTGKRSIGEMVGKLEFDVDPSKCMGERVRFRASMKPNSETGRLMMCLGAQLNSGQIGAHELQKTKRRTLGEWSEYEIVLDIPDQVEEIQLSFLLQGMGEFFIDNVSLEIVDESVAKSVQSAADLSKNIKSEPGLFEIKGAMEVSTDQLDADELRILVPMPLLYRKQFPLTYHLSTNPPSALKSVRIYEDKPGNFVAEMTLQDFSNHKRVNVEFNSLILVLPDTFEEVPAEAAIPGNWPDEAKPWLRPTWCVGSADDRIRAIAEEIRSETNDVFEIIRQVESRAQAIYEAASGFVTDHTAVQMLDRKGTCTGCANLVAGLLRASDVPARVLAGYPSWSGPLSTHYIVEAYVPGTGWYPIESRLCRSPWPNKNQINVAIVDPQYETEAFAGYRSGIAGGVPYLTLAEILDNDGKFIRAGTLEERDGCFHLCNFVRKLEASESGWAAAADWASRRWESWRRSNPMLEQGQLRFGPPNLELKSNSISELIDELKR